MASRLTVIVHVAKVGTGKTSDTGAYWGKDEVKGVDGKTGKPWVKIKPWFVYNLHVIADNRYEIPVAVHVT